MTIMDILEEAQFQLWAEKKYFELLKQIPDENWSKIKFDFTKSVQEIYVHKYEVIFFWLTLLHVKDSKKVEENPLKIPDFEPLTKDQFITEALKLFDMVIEFLKTTNDENITFNLHWLSKPYVASSHEIIYNMINHLTYHRGQIAFLFKKFGISEIPETDYNPYLYELRHVH